MVPVDAIAALDQFEAAEIFAACAVEPIDGCAVDTSVPGAAPRPSEHGEIALTSSTSARPREPGSMNSAEPVAGCSGQDLDVVVVDLRRGTYFPSPFFHARTNLIISGVARSIASTTGAFLSEIPLHSSRVWLKMAWLAKAKFANRR